MYEMKNLLPILLVLCSVTSLMAQATGPVGGGAVAPEPSTYGIAVGVLALGFVAYRSFTKRK